MISNFIISENENQIQYKTKSGYQHIISSESRNKPYKVIINGVEKIYTEEILISNLELEENNVILQFNSQITSCYYMFLGCGSIIEMDLTYLDSSLVHDISSMFYRCKSLRSVKFGNFPMSKLYDIKLSFSYCESLLSLDLSNFDTTNVTSFSYMFRGCKSLQSLDLSNFKTSSLNRIFAMFEDCSSLRSIIISGFNTSKVTNMANMFYNCKQLSSLDLSSFELKSISNMNKMFFGCEILEYVIIKSYFRFSNSSLVSYEGLLDSTPSNLIFCVNDLKTPNNINSLKDNRCSGCSIKKSDLISWISNSNDYCCHLTCEECDIPGNDKYHNCIQCKTNYDLKIEFNGYNNCYKKCDNLYYIDDNNQMNCVNSDNCPNKYSKLISEKKQCVGNCESEKEYIYEYKNNCYKKCPNGTEESKEISFYCINICTKDLPYKLIKTDECVSYCPTEDLLVNNCQLNYEDNNTNDINIENNIINFIKQDLIRGYNTSELDSGNDVIIERNNTTYIITTTENQKKEKKRTTINLGKCETNLKNYYNISEEEPLYILKIDVKKQGLKIPKIEYEIYYPLNGSNLIKLDLSICQNDKIEITIPVQITDIIDKYDPQSDYYNDICYTVTSENGTDIILSDRKEEFIENNMALCEEDCTFVKYDYINNKSICSCENKT